MEQLWLDPLRDMAKRLGFDRLHKALVEAKPSRWYSECKRNGQKFEAVVDSWLDTFIIPALLQERSRAVRKRVKDNDAITTMNAPYKPGASDGGGRSDDVGKVGSEDS